MLVPASTAAAVTAQFLSLDLELTSCDALPACVATSRFDGDETALQVEEVEAGQYRAVIVSDDLGPVDLVWEGVVDGRTQRVTGAVEVVGGEVASVLDVVTHPDMRSRLNVDRHRLRRLLDEFTDVFTRYRGESPVPRREVEHLAHDRSVLRWPEARDVTVTHQGAQIPDPVVVDGVLDRSTWPPGVAVVDYVHSYPVVTDGLRRAAVSWVAATVVAEAAGMARDALWQTSDSGTIRYSTPDWARGRPTGLIGVDAALNSYPDHRLPGIA